MAGGPTEDSLPHSGVNFTFRKLGSRQLPRTLGAPGRSSVPKLPLDGLCQLGWMEQGVCANLYFYDHPDRRPV